MPQYINIIVFLPFRRGGGGGGGEGESPNLNQNTLCSLQLRKLSTFSECNFIRSPGPVTVGGGGGGGGPRTLCLQPVPEFSYTVYTR